MLFTFICFFSVVWGMVDSDPGCYSFRAGICNHFHGRWYLFVLLSGMLQEVWWRFTARASGQ